MHVIKKFLSSYKSIIAIMLMVILWTGNAWAQTPTTLCPTDTTEQATSLLNIILTFLSWIWIVLATLAGKLMTNGFIYGEFMNLDKVLYYLRNISRTFANFLIVGLLLYTIITKALKGTLTPGEVVEFIIKKLILGVILINASWFIIGAMVDISTILTSAAGSLPSSYIASNGQNMRDTITQSLQIHGPSKKITYNLGTSICSALKAAETSPTNTTNNTSQDVDINKLLDMVLPNETSVSGPLLYLGVSVFQIQNFLNNTNDPKAIIDNLFVVGVRLAITLMFTFALVLLVMVNIFRLVTIWFAVAFGPILILLYLNDQQKILQDIGKKFSPFNITKAIFAPVIAVAMLSLGLIVIVIMQRFLQLNTNIERGDAYVSSSAQGSRIGVNQIFDTMIAGDILGEENQTGTLIKNTFSNILLIIFTLFILFGITKLLSSYLSKGFGGETIGKIAELGGKALGSIPMIPTSQGAISVGGAEKGLKRMKNDFENKLSLSTGDADNKIENSIRKMMGLDAKLSSSDLKDIYQRSKKFKDSGHKVNATDYSSMRKSILNIVNVGGYNNKKIPITSMQGIPSALSSFFKNMANNQITPQSILGNEFSNKPLIWAENDTEQNFIEKNYKDHKKFFQKIYSDIGGDSDYIDRKQGKDFWNGNMRWKNETSP